MEIESYTKLKEFLEFIDNKSEQPKTAITKVEDLINTNFTHINVKNRNVKGFGSSENVNLALAKAISEYIERKTFFKVTSNNSEIQKTSSGMACHLSYELARETGENELIERDALLTTWLSYKAPMWLSASQIESLCSNDLSLFIEKFKSKNFQLLFGVVAFTNNTYTTISCLKPLDRTLCNFGFAIDTSSSKSLNEAFMKSVKTMSYVATMILNRQKANYPLYKKIKADEIKSTADHLEYYLNPANKCEWFFESSDDIFELPAQNIITQQIQEYNFGRIKRVVTKSESINMQNYFTGITNDIQVSKDRLLSLGINLNSINREVHPLS